MAKLSGIVRSGSSFVKLQTTKGSLDLDPFPQDAPLSDKRRLDVGKELFGYLDGREVLISGRVSGSKIFDAHLSSVGFSPVQDVLIEPSSQDPFAKDIHQFFKQESRGIAQKLNDLGIRTVSAFYHRVESGRDELKAFSKYLHVSTEDIRGFLEKIRSDPATQNLIQASPRFPVQRGINLAALAKVKGIGVKKPPKAPPKFPTTAETEDLPTYVNLAPFVTSVKDQGMRGTCVAHAAAAFLESEYIQAGKATSKLDLSEQYLYWACKSLDGSPKTSGTFIEFATRALLNGVPSAKLPGGICGEKNWPYNAIPKDSDEAQGPLPPSAKKGVQLKKYRATSVNKLRHNSIRAIKEALANGHCVGISVYTYHFWTNDFAWREGVISLPLGIAPDGAHAICLVGYKDDRATPHGDGNFIFKNSWSTKWGWGRPDPGFGTLPYRYVLQEAIEAYAVEI